MIHQFFATGLPVLKSTSSPYVAVGLLAYTFLKRGAVGSSGANGSTRAIPGG